MTKGINLRDIVIIRASGTMAEVIGIDDHTDCFPADLKLNTGHGIIKARADEVMKYDKLSHEKLYGKAPYPFT